MSIELSGERIQQSLCLVFLRLLTSLNLYFLEIEAQEH